MANYVLRVSDAGSPVGFNDTEPVTVLVPSDAKASIPIGSPFQVDQLGAGTVTLVADSGVTINGSTLATSGQFTSLQLRKTALNTFMVVSSGGGGTGGTIDGGTA